MIYVPDDVSGEIVSAVSIHSNDEAMIITSTGKTIKIEAESVRILEKNARGVRIVNIDPPDYVNGLDKVIQEKVEKNEDAEIQDSSVQDQIAEQEDPGKGGDL
jgi:DNA gyrase subunit A